MKEIKGSCHCKNIQYYLHWPKDVTAIATRACGCSFCKKHAGAWTSNTDAVLRASISVPKEVTQYHFGTRTAVFYVCKTCGAVPFVTSMIESRLHAVINTNTFDNCGEFEFITSATDFDGEDTQERIARRQRNWINQVEIINYDR